MHHHPWQFKQENIYTIFNFNQGYFGDDDNGAKALFGSLKIDTKPSSVIIRGGAKNFSADGFAGLKDGALGSEGNMSMLTFDGGIGLRVFGYQLDTNLKLFVGGIAGGRSAGLNNSLLPRGSISFGAGLGGSLEMSINRVEQ